MFKYIVKRILSSILVLLGVVTITFFISRVIPSNPEVKWAGSRATPEQLQAAREELGLDKSIPEQYVIYLNDLLHGDLGDSLNSHQPVATELKRYIPATLELVLLAFFFAILLGIPLGIYSAKKEGQAIGPLQPVFLHRRGIIAHFLGGAVFAADLLQDPPVAAHRRPSERGSHDL